MDPGDGGQLEWIMDRDGITVVFNPYVLGPWSEGSLESRMTFADCPDLLLETSPGPGREQQCSFQRENPFTPIGTGTGKRRSIFIRYRWMRRRIHHPLPLAGQERGQRRRRQVPGRPGTMGALRTYGFWKPGMAAPSYGSNFPVRMISRVLEVFTLQNENGTLVLYYVGSSERFHVWELHRI